VSVLTVYQNVELPLLCKEHQRGPAQNAALLALLEKVGCATNARTARASCRAASASASPIARAIVTRPQLVSRRAARLASVPRANHPRPHADPPHRGDDFHLLDA